MRKCVSEEFIKFCDEKYPALQDNAAFRRMFMYLCFGTFLHSETGKLAISYMTVAKLAGKQDAAKGKNFKAFEFLGAFKEVVLPEFTWMEPEEFDDGYGESNWNDHKYCRSVNDDGLDEATKMEVSKQIGWTGPKYYFETKKLFSRANAAKEKKGVLAQYENESKVFNLNKTQASIFNGLKDVSLNGRAFTQKMNENQDVIMAAIDNLQVGSDDKISLDDKKDQQKKILDSIKEDPRIFYRPTPLSRTCRLHHSTECALSLESSVRKAFCKGWTEADLVSSQFVILSAILNAPLCKAFIASKQHLWTYLHNFATGSVEKPSKAEKAIYKQVIYGICFGMEKRTIKKDLTAKGMVKLLKCPIIKELLEKREEWFDAINGNGYVTDVWNKKHELQNAGTVKDIYGNLVNAKARWAGSLAATKIQSIEMEIIESVFDCAVKIGEKYQWQITMFQHDGFTISYNNKDRKEAVEKQIKEAVKNRAADLGKKLGLDLYGVDIEFNNL